MRVPRLLFAMFIVAATMLLPAHAEKKSAYFSISSRGTFAPGEKATISVSTQNADALEFRVYRIQDPAKFFAQLEDPHSMGHGPAFQTQAEQIDEKTWLEKFHDWKRDLWRSIRDFFRSQFSHQNRAKVREKQAKPGKTTAILNEAQFAQVPVLNSKQLVAKWHQAMPRAYYSEKQALPDSVRDAGAYLVEATDGTLRAYTIVLISQKILVTKTADDRVIAFFADRVSGAPAGGGDIHFWNGKDPVRNAKTAEDGTAQFDIASKPEEVRIVAVSGNDVAVVAPESYYFGNRGSALATYVYTDRPVYRPGHTVHVKAVLRNREDDSLTMPGAAPVPVAIFAPEDKMVLHKDVPVSAMGSLHFDFDVPADAPLGDYRIAVADREYAGSFYVEEYKKPEYQVKVTAKQQHLREGEKITAVFDARYFFGEPVANANVTYVVHSSPHYNWDYDADEESEYDGEEGGDSGGYEYDYGGSQEDEQHGKLDANGKLTVTIPTRVSDKKQDLEYRIEARVTDAANREISGHARVLATYGDFTVSVRPNRYLYGPQDTPSFTVTAKDYDNKMVQTAVHLVAKHSKWYMQSHPKDQEVVGERDVTTDANGTAGLDWKLGAAGDYYVTATAPSGDRQVESTSWVWIYGSDTSWNRNDRKITMVADKKTYQPGDTAKIFISTGKPDSYVLVTAEGSSLQSKQVVHAADGTTTFELPVTAVMQPNIFVNATAVHDSELYQGSVNVKVPPASQRLTVTITPSKPQFQPGEKASYDLLATDASGKPVRAELSVGVVDEAIYSVRPETTGDVLDAFYPKRYKLYNTSTSLEFYFTGHAGKKALELALTHPGYSPANRMAQVKGGDLIQPKVRKAFPDTSFWSPAVITDSSGHARVTFSFPDSLTTWRSTVRAITADTKGGATVDRVIVRKNLMARLAAPRFFRQGDEITVSTIVHNYLTSAKTVRVSLDARGLDFVGGHEPRDVQIASRSEAKVDWRLRAGNIGNGTAVLTTKALTNEESDALEITLPIRPFGVKMGIARSGSISQTSGSQSANFEFPVSDPSSRSVDVTLSSSVAGPIFSALDYLTSYPYGCTEQTMSSFLPDVIVSHATDKLHLKTNVTHAELTKMIRAGLDRLYSYQHDDGGWGWWKEDDSHLYMTAYVVGGLSQAKDAGFDVDTEKVNKAKVWLKNMLRDHPKMIGDLQAYLVYSLVQAGERDAAMLDALWEKRSKLTPEGVAHAGLAFRLAGDARANQFASDLEKQAVDQELEAHWQSQNDYLLDISNDDTSVEATAIALKFLSGVDAQSPLLPKAALWLVNHRDQGYWWESTKQTASAIYGLIEYVAQSHELDANFSAEVLVNGKTISAQHLGSLEKSAAPATIHVDASTLGPSNAQIEVRKSGNGRLYWSARANYYSTQKHDYQVGTMKLNVTRDYYRLRSYKKDDKIVYALDALNSAVQVGDILAVHLTIAGSDSKYLLIEDPIPAGTEFIERDDLYELDQKPRWWSWYYRREFHDDHAAFFDRYLSGTRDFYYLLKVVNPGNMQVSPPLAQPMYQPNIMATGDPIKVEAK